MHVTFTSLVFVAAALWFILLQLYNSLPNVPTDADFSSFRTYRARDHLRGLCKGPRVAGSLQAERDTVSFLVNTLNTIAQKAGQNVSVEIDTQVSSGSYFLYSRDGVTMVYKDLHNVVAKVIFEGSIKSEPFLLLNAHYDSKPLSPGASDDAISCSILLEILESLLEEAGTGHVDFRRNLMILFNGAEEQGLPASHGFITKHPWAKEAGAFINLEAAGSGGREVLFQSGPGNPWLLDAYLESAVYPSASVCAQEVFQNNLIPSDTDFRIFRDYGGLPGLDIAFIQNGYVYHTTLDTIDRIPVGSFYRAGENVLQVTRKLLALKSWPTSNISKTSQPVYFDVLGFFVISYSGSLWNIIAVPTLVHLLICALGFANGWQKFFHLEKKLERLFTLLKMCGICTVIGLIIYKLGYTMSWFSHSYILGPLYAFPALWIFILSLKHEYKEIPMELARELRLRHATDFFMCVTFLLTICGIRSAYILALFVLFPTIGDIASTYFTDDKKEFIVQMFVLIPLANLYFFCYLLFDTFIPIMGRMGIALNPDVVMGVFVAVIVFLSVLYMSSAMNLSDDICLKRNYVQIGLMIGFFVQIGVLFCGTYQPYTRETPQRLFLIHTLRENYAVDGKLIRQDSGVSFEQMDPNDNIHVLETYVKELKHRFKPSKGVCEEMINCGIATERPRLSAKKSYWWIEFSPPQIPESIKVSLEVLNSTQMAMYTRTYFLLKGPALTTLYLSPDAEMQFLGWSLSNDTSFINSKAKWKEDRFTYFASFVTGVNGHLANCAHQFYIDFKSPRGGGNYVITAFGHFQFGEHLHDNNFQAMLSKFPEWTFPWGWTAHTIQKEFKILDLKEDSSHFAINREVH